jgi:hypothetical protein
MLCFRSYLEIVTYTCITPILTPRAHLIATIQEQTLIIMPNLVHDIAKVLIKWALFQAMLRFLSIAPELL